MSEERLGPMDADLDALLESERNARPPSATLDRVWTRLAAYHRGWEQTRCARARLDGLASRSCRAGCVRPRRRGRRRVACDPSQGARRSRCLRLRPHTRIVPCRRAGSRHSASRRATGVDPVSWTPALSRMSVEEG